MPDISQTWGAPIEVANAAKARIRQERIELLTAIESGLVHFPDILTDAIRGENRVVLSKTPVFKLMVLSGTKEIDALRVLRWAAAHLGWPRDAALKRIALCQFIVPSRRYTHLVALADAMTASEREAPSQGYPYRRGTGL